MHDSKIQQRAYDAFLYPDEPHFWTEPARIAATASLYGYAPKSVATARILEIGCASGGNIIPMAVRYPHAHFVGFDISGKQIEQAQAHAHEVGLTNLTLLQADICDLPLDLGRFDYIIGHGICSWVPPGVRAALWVACRELLHDDGLLYLSYNTLPGWHFKRVVRDLLQFRSEGAPLDDARLQEALAFFRRTNEHATGVYRHLLDIEAQFMTETDTNYIRHEYLEEENHAFYVRDFLHEASEAGFSFLCEADPASPSLDSLLQPIVAAIERDAGESRPLREQYIDFQINRTFRRSLFMRAQTPTIRRIEPSALAKLYLVPATTAPAQAVQGENTEMSAYEARMFAFIGEAAGIRGKLTEHAFGIVKDAVPYASRTIAVAEVVEKLQTQFGLPVEDVQASAWFAIGELLLRRAFVLSTEPAAWSFDTETPKLQDLLRSDAANGRPASVNVLHEKITLKSDRTRLVLSLLDGKRNRDALIAELLPYVEDGTIDVADDGEIDQGVDTLTTFLTSMLDKLAQLRLLC